MHLSSGYTVHDHKVIMRHPLAEIKMKETQTTVHKHQQQTTYPTVEALATDLGISRQSAYAALRRGEIPHIRIGKRFVIPRAAIQEWLRTAGTLPTAS